jgi:ABC-type multidrug transport system fused ATPase/permease subunit
VKEFVVYTGLRILLFVASLAVVAGIWLLLTDEVPVLWVLILGFALSGVASYFLLNRQRAAFASRVETRAQKASVRFEEMRAREDVDGPEPGK